MISEEIEKVIEILKDGGIVIFPTDTAFGIGCRIDDKEAIKRLFKIRRRPKRQAVPVLVDTVKMAQEYLLPIPKEVVDRLIEPYWPGALTIVLPCKKEKVPELVRGGGTTLGVRIPNYKVTRAIIRGVGKPILGPSANFHGEKTPFWYEDLNRELTQLVDYVVFGECTIRQTSTVIDCSQKPWRIVREGAVTVQNTLLLIDTSNNKTITVGLRIDGKEHVMRRLRNAGRPQVVLTLIEGLLRRHHVKLTDIEAIEVNTGPGSFTGLRVGIAVANALSYALNVPINRQRPRSFVAPVYE